MPPGQGAGFCVEEIGDKCRGAGVGEVFHAHHQANPSVPVGTRVRLVGSSAMAPWAGRRQRDGLGDGWWVVWSWRVAAPMGHLFFC